VQACQPCADTFGLWVASAVRRTDPIGRLTPGWVVFHKGQQVSRHWSKRAATRAARWWVMQ
jgi:hypothetical protein